MDKKKILVVSRAFYPMNSPRSFRATELVKEFCRQGHDVTLVTVKYAAHDSLAKEYGFKVVDIGKLNYKRLQVKGSGIVRLISKILVRGIEILFEYPDIELVSKVKQALKGMDGYDLMISIAAPHPVHWGVAKARTSNNKIARVWVADCGDPYMGSTLDNYKKPFYFKYFEKAFCRKADYISVPVDGAKKGYYPEFLSKIKVISQGFKFEESQIFMQPFIPTDIPTFAYAGSFSPGKRDPRPLIEFLLQTGKSFKFYIFTNMPQLILPYLDRAKGMIEVKSFIPRNELLSFLSKMDFVLNIDNGNATQVPSKLIDYLIINKPILSINSNQFNSEVVLEFLNGNYNSRYQFNDPEQYKIENVCRKFLQLA